MKTSMLLILSLCLLAGVAQAEPRVFVGQATEMSAKVVAIDPNSRKATFEFADGTTKAIKIPTSVDLSQHKVGETVVVGFAESIVIAVSRP